MIEYFGTRSITPRRHSPASADHENACCSCFRGGRWWAATGEYSMSGPVFHHRSSKAWAHASRVMLSYTSDILWIRNGLFWHCSLHIRGDPAQEHLICMCISWAYPRKLYNHCLDKRSLDLVQIGKKRDCGSSARCMPPAWLITSSVWLSECDHEHGHVTCVIPRNWGFVCSREKSSSATWLMCVNMRRIRYC